MKLIHVPMMDEERIAAYIDGKLSPEEMDAFKFEMAQDDALAEFVSDFKDDLNMVNNEITMEHFEPNFEPMNAVDTLFSDTYDNTSVGMEFNSVLQEQANPLDMYLGFAMKESQGITEGEVPNYNTHENGDIVNIPGVGDDGIMNIDDNPTDY